MKFGLTGDTHNNLKNIEIICQKFNELSLDFVIHTGDITLAKSLEKFSELNMPLKGVFGNNDVEEKKKLLEVCEEYNFQFSDKLKISLPNKSFLFAVHDPKDIEDYFYSPGNIIVHGHTHRLRNEEIDGTFIFNPGECAGMMKGMNKIGVVNVNKPIMELINF